MRQRRVVSSFIFTSPQAPGGFQVSIFRRSNKESTYQEVWGACSGSIELSDPTPEFAAWRELREETTLTNSDLLIYRRGKYFKFIDKALQIEWIVYPFAFQLLPQAKSLKIDWEHTEYKFIEPIKLQDYKTVPNLQLSLSRVLVGPETEAHLKALKEDHCNGAEVLAILALKALLQTVRGNDLKGSLTVEDFWEKFRLVAWHLAKNGRPSMGTVIETALFRSMDIVQTEMTRTVPAILQKSDGAALLSFKSALEATLRASSALQYKNLMSVAKNFTKYITEKHVSREEVNITLVTLSSSSTITKCLTDLIWSFAMRKWTVKLIVLESRPLFEGVASVNALTESLEKEIEKTSETCNLFGSLMVEIVSDASAAMVVKEADFVVIGADKVSTTGDVSNKIGSLALATLVKTLHPKCVFVTVFGTDKIMGHHEQIDLMGSECNNGVEVSKAWPKSLNEALKETVKEGYKIEVRNEYFEWIQASYIDRYISEKGILSLHDIAEESSKGEKMQSRIFGEW